MARSVIALVTPELLVWARQSANLRLDEAASRLHISSERLHAWESGNESPTVAQLRKCASAYRRPLAVFYLPSPPKDFQPIKDFRRSVSDRPVEFSYNLILSIREVYQRRLDAIELSEALGSAITKFTASNQVEESTTNIANTIAQYFKISESANRKWENEFEAYKGWRRIIEGKGILTFQMNKVEIDDARGFSIYSDVFPAVVVNGKDSIRGRIFTLIHELAHLFYRTEGACDLLDDVDGGHSKVEIMCNRVAASVLLPNEAFSRWYESELKEVGGTLTDDILWNASKYWHVSREAVLRRLVTLNFVNQSYYRQKREDFLQEYSKYSARKQQGGPPPHKKAIYELGSLFSNLALEAFSEEKITANELSTLLKLKIKHLPKLKAELWE